MWWNDEIKAAVRRKEDIWKEMLTASDEEAKERCMEKCREEKIKVKRCTYQSKKKVNKQFRRKVNEDLNENMKLFWNEVSNAKGGKVETCKKIKDINRRLAQGEDEVRMIWKAYYEDLYNIDTQEQVAVDMCGFDGIRRCNYFEAN